jgi:ABC-type antimicrobial peptide transport system permease subunit
MYLPGEIDWRVMSLSAGICLVATLIVGLVPAFQTRNINLAGALKVESTGVVGARGTAWVRSGLVVAFASAVAVMTITSVAACLLPAWRATRTDPARVLRD